MKPSLEKIRELAEAMGWVEIKPQNNPYMISFKDAEFEETRVNVYFTTMSVTVQSRKKWGVLKNSKHVTLEQLEEIFTDYI